MAYRTAAEPAGLPWPEPFLASPRVDRPPRRRDDSAPLAPLAILTLCLTFAAGVSVAYRVGGQVERGQEFGQLVALQALEPQLRVAAARCGVEAQRLATLGVPARRPVNRAPAPLGTTISLPAPTVPPIPLPQIRP